MNTAHLFSLLLTQSIELSAAIAVVWILTVTVFRRRPHLAYALWLVVLAKAVTPPVWSCPTGVFSWALRESYQVSAIQPQPIMTNSSASQIAHPFIPPPAPTLPATLSPETPSVGPAPTASPPLHLMRSAPAILLVCSTGSTLVFATILIMTARLRRRVLRSTVDSDHPAVRRVTQITPPGTPQIVMSTGSIGPALIGIYRPLIVIPLHLVETLSDRELSAIIAHESTHLRRGDHWVAAFQRLVISIWWFNPLVWFAHHQINRARELCCDGQTVAYLACDPADYAQMLLDVLRLRRATLSTQTLFPGVHAMQITHRRLSALLTTRGAFTRRVPVSAWVTLIAAGFVIIPGSGFVQTLAAQTRTPQTRTPQTQTPQTPATTAPATHTSAPPIIFHGVLSDLRLRWPLKDATVTITFDANTSEPNQSTAKHDLAPATVTTTASNGTFDVVVPGDLASENPNLDISIEMYHPRYGHRHLVSRWLPGFQNEAEWVRKNAPDRSTLPRLDIQLTTADQLVGMLVGPDHRALADATVAVTSIISLSQLELLSDTVRTDSAGRFVVPAYGGGQTSILIRPKDAAAFRLNPSATADDGRIDIGTVVAPAGQSITGTVSNADGKPRVGWTVAARPVPNHSRFGFDDAPVRTGTTDAAGRFTLQPVAVGAVQLTAIDPAGNGSQTFPDGMSVPMTYFGQAKSGGISPVIVNVSADRPVPAVDLRPSPQVRVVVKATDPQGRPAEPLETFVTGKVNGINGAWRALQSGPDTVEALVPKGVTDARVGINDLSADDGQTVARVRRGDGPAIDAGMADLGTLDHDITDLTVVRFPRPKLTITITDTSGRDLPAALTALRYARPSPGNPYWDRLTRGSGSPQTLRSYDVFPGQPFTLSTSLDGYTTDTRDLMLDWKTDRAITIRLTPTTPTHPEKAD